MLLHAPTSTLLIIDIQERLFPAIHDAEAVLQHSAWLLAVARRLGVPALATEQYSKGLGQTLAQLREQLPAEAILEKIAFSAVADPGLLQLPGGERRQFVVCGTEAHVCVLQTVLGLLAEDREVYVVAEAVGSRRPEDKALALERMRQAGAVIVNREMVAFEWLERAGSETFRAVSREFIR
ncbi:Nicotinamidase-related amidase [Pseudomonas delhiensis]|uniref:Nicotinamidase-related amidase n=1 Tax=Pseudomonas delhiensis TaxID=366289 RepID=A0A239DUC1_9PSED|nr:hydrolase [Pseudomonas delhiensis]SDI91369.1 Nicotinamidase-related amidase [Pseudomonas delhiensis]SNS35164.1 Nicotinamidase-related amidase [Pseudomonas delhiensis]